MVSLMTSFTDKRALRASGFRDKQHWEPIACGLSTHGSAALQSHHEVMTAFKPLPGHPCSPGFLSCRSWPILCASTAPACPSFWPGPRFCIHTHHRVAAGARCWAALHSSPPTSLTPAGVCSLEHHRSFSDHNSCLQLGPTNLGDSLNSDSLSLVPFSAFFNRKEPCGPGLPEPGLSFCQSSNH